LNGHGKTQNVLTIVPFEFAAAM